MSTTQYATYVPYSRRRVTDLDPQRNPELFSDADLMKEVRMLIRMNTKHGSHPLRTVAYTKLMQFIDERKASEGRA
jgi:hypothetical protein